MRSPTTAASRSRAGRRAARSRSTSSRCAGGALVADLPGYGYAAVSKSVKRDWQDFLWHYLTHAQRLVALVLVVDARHGLSDLDRAVLDAIVPTGRPVLILATKADKLGKSRAARSAGRPSSARVARGVSAGRAQMSIVQLFSATTRAGRARRRKPRSRMASASCNATGWSGIGAQAKKRPRDQGE